MPGPSLGTVPTSTMGPCSNAHRTVCPALVALSILRCKGTPHPVTLRPNPLPNGTASKGGGKCPKEPHARYRGGGGQGGGPPSRPGAWCATPCCPRGPAERSRRPRGDAAGPASSPSCSRGVPLGRGPPGSWVRTMQQQELPEPVRPALTATAVRVDGVYLEVAAAAASVPAHAKHRHVPAMVRRAQVGPGIHEGLEGGPQPAPHPGPCTGARRLAGLPAVDQLGQDGQRRAALVVTDADIAARNAPQPQHMIQVLKPHPLRAETPNRGTLGPRPLIADHTHGTQQRTPSALTQTPSNGSMCHPLSTHIGVHMHTPIHSPCGIHIHSDMPTYLRSLLHPHRHNQFEGI